MVLFTQKASLRQNGSPLICSPFPCKAGSRPRLSTAALGESLKCGQLGNKAFESVLCKVGSALGFCSKGELNGVGWSRSSRERGSRTGLLEGAGEGMQRQRHNQLSLHNFQPLELGRDVTLPTHQTKGKEGSELAGAGLQGAEVPGPEPEPALLMSTRCLRSTLPGQVWPLALWTEQDRCAHWTTREQASPRTPLGHASTDQPTRALRSPCTPPVMPPSPLLGNVTPQCHTRLTRPHMRTRSCRFLPLGPWPWQNSSKGPWTAERSFPNTHLTGHPHPKPYSRLPGAQSYGPQNTIWGKKRLELLFSVSFFSHPFLFLFIYALGGTQYFSTVVHICHL